MSLSTDEAGAILLDLRRLREEGNMIPEVRSPKSPPPSLGSHPEPGTSTLKASRARNSAARNP